MSQNFFPNFNVSKVQKEVAKRISLPLSRYILFSTLNLVTASTASTTYSHGLSIKMPVQ